MTRDILITGGTGFIGSCLALHYARDGRRVRVLGRCRNEVERQRALELTRLDVEVREGSVTSRQDVELATQGVQLVHHLAAAQHEANVPDQYFQDVNVEGARNVVESCIRCGVQRLVHGSTIGVYGPCNGTPVHDGSPLEPDNIYGRTKLAGEEVVRQAAGQLPVVIVRISETYGPGDRRLLKLFRGVASGKFLRIGPGTNLHHPIYVDDLVEVLWRAAEQPAAVGQTFVASGPMAISTDQMVTDIAHALELPEPRYRVPLWPILCAAGAMETLLRPLGIQPPLHRRRVHFFTKSFRFSGEPLRSLLNYQPQVDFAEGARRTARWYRQEKLL